jgi:hypothetical protein
LRRHGVREGISHDRIVALRVAHRWAAGSGRGGGGWATPFSPAEEAEVPRTVVTEAEAVEGQLVVLHASNVDEIGREAGRGADGIP